MAARDSRRVSSFAGPKQFSNWKIISELRHSSPSSSCHGGNQQSIVHCSSCTVFRCFGGAGAPENLFIVWKQLIFSLKELTTFIVFCAVASVVFRLKAKILCHQIAPTLTVVNEGILQKPKTVWCCANGGSSIENPSAIECTDLAGCCCCRCLVSRPRSINSAQTVVDGKKCNCV